MNKHKGLDDITANIIRKDMEKIKNYAEEIDPFDVSIDQNEYLYSVVDISKLLHVNNYGKSISNYLEPKEKIKIYVISQKKMITLLTIKGVGRFIYEQYIKKNKIPDKIICDFFHFYPKKTQQVNNAAGNDGQIGKLELENNIYVKKLRNILFTKEHIIINWPIPKTDKTIDVFFPNHGIAILFESRRVRTILKDFKRKSIFLNIKKEYPSIKGDIHWLCFTEYDRSHATKNFMKLIGSINDILFYE